METTQTNDVDRGVPHPSYELNGQAARMEAWAMSETTAFYPVGKYRTTESPANHLLFMDGNVIPGNHG